MKASKTGRQYPTAPKCVKWFKAYCAILALCYIFCIGLSFVFFLIDPVELDMEPFLARIMGAMFLVLGTILFSACILPFFLRPKPWVWIYDLVIICIGFASMCFWPFCIPLLIFWLKTETKSYFGKI